MAVVVVAVLFGPFWAPTTCRAGVTWWASNTVSATRTRSFKNQWCWVRAELRAQAPEAAAQRAC